MLRELVLEVLAHGALQGARAVLRVPPDLGQVGLGLVGEVDPERPVREPLGEPAGSREPK